MKIDIPAFIYKSKKEFREHWDSLFNNNPQQDLLDYSFMQTRLDKLLKRYQDLDRDLQYKAEGLVNHVLQVYDESLYEKIKTVDSALYNTEYGSAKWHYLTGVLEGLKFVESAIKQEQQEV